MSSVIPRIRTSTQVKLCLFRLFETVNGTPMVNSANGQSITKPGYLRVSHGLVMNTFQFFLSLNVVNKVPREWLQVMDCWQIPTMQQA